ncbi:MAG: 2,3-bisphosphoglycerate-dependent phosphoglycerate mutase [Solirubrobacteraceae bacterium]|jgi:probable phosphoglycerate mutase|nr:2,3-bisphosphoglycerate-dependent phosphoglycerate mutase [Solirubrobacteraceae bacterium]
MPAESKRDSFEQKPYQPPPGATEVTLVRHGASQAAVAGQRFELVDGHSNPPLSAVPGRHQAQLVADALRDEAFDRAFVTPLRRTQETAAPFLAATGMEAEVIEEFVEVSLGDWEGGEYRIRAGRGDPLIAQMHAEQRWDVIPGGETLDSLGARVRAGMERVVAATGPGRRAVVFGHGAVIGEICRQACDARGFAFIHSDNGSISRVIVSADGAWLLRSFNDTTHLR